MVELWIEVLRERTSVLRHRLIREMVVGRTDLGMDDPDPISIRSAGDVDRLCLFEFDEASKPRRWFEIRPHGSEGFEVENLSPQHPISVEGRQTIEPSVSVVFHSTTELRLAEVLTMRLQVREDLSKERLHQPHTQFEVERPRPLQTQELVDARLMTQMVRTAVEAVQSAVGTTDFFESALTAAIEIIAIERCCLLLRKDSCYAEQLAEEAKFAFDDFSVMWKLAEPRSDRNERMGLSRTLVSKVIDSKKTLIFDPSSCGGKQTDGTMVAANSLDQTDCAVATPILDPDQKVIGMLYADRTLAAVGEEVAERRISDIEASLLEILAGAVSAGLVRQQTETRRSRLSGYFSNRLMEQIEADPKLLVGREVEVTLLFCDIRKFSSSAQRLGPSRTIEWINDAMSNLSQLVTDSDGIVVGFAGDEMFAMWGAPGIQPDHATRAFETALRIGDAIDELRTRWEPELPEGFHAGVGINTGVACVGNIGSNDRFTYGPLSNAVNLAARYQTATKQFGVQSLLGRPTVDAAEIRHRVRRIGKIRVVGIVGGTEVFELPRDPECSDWRRLRDGYENALKAFEFRCFDQALHEVESLRVAFPGDEPTRKLQDRIRRFRETDSGFDDGIWNFHQK